MNILHDGFTVGANIGTAPFCVFDADGEHYQTHRNEASARLQAHCLNIDLIAADVNDFTTSTAMDSENTQTVCKAYVNLEVARILQRRFDARRTVDALRAAADALESGDGIAAVKFVSEAFFRIVAFHRYMGL